jgi:hypothetical protein
MFKKCGSWGRHHTSLIILGIVLIIAAFIRIWTAEISSGPDVTQFWAFAKVFQQHGLDFYRYADAQLGIFPNKGWGFVYPPIWLLILRISLFFVPLSRLYGVGSTAVASPSWRLAAKMPIIIADLAIGLLLYWGVPGSKRKKVFFASLWLLHPTAWFESGVFGQFDSIAAAFLLTFVILLMKGKDRLAFVFAGLAVMTKQHTLLAVGMIFIVCTRTFNFKRLLTDCAITAGVIAAISIPFVVTGNFVSYVRSIVYASSPPGYQDPLCFSFSGPGALLTFLHNTVFYDATTMLSLIAVVFIDALFITALMCYKRKVTLLQAGLAGYLIFIAIYYHINYQYLIVYIPLALLLAATTKYKIERIFALAIAILPAVWIWITNIPWWFHDTKSGYSWVPNMLKHLGMPDRYLPDWTYVILALAIMALSIAYIVLAFTRWTENKDNKLQS